MQQQILLFHSTDLISAAPHTQKEHEEETAVAGSNSNSRATDEFPRHETPSSKLIDNTCLPASDLF
jgi:hypothetical protein